MYMYMYDSYCIEGYFQGVYNYFVNFEIAAIRGINFHEINRKKMPSHT